MPVSMTKGGATYYFAYDQTGSLKAVADSTGTVVKTIEYDSFGYIIGDSNENFAVPFGFAGGLHDRDTGLIRFGYRDYDPEVGRWTAKDPILFDGGDSDLYGYVLNDPVNYIDPEGLIFWAAKRIGKWGLKKTGKLTRDEAKRQFKKEGKDIVGSKKALKKFAKDKGKGKTGNPIYETHGDGTPHWHTPDRNGGHGFTAGLAAFLTLLDYIDPISILFGAEMGDATIEGNWGDYYGDYDNMCP